ncbi:DNA-binding protein c1d [Clonorchis sinensis]|uniref:Nuclear nucleic acid-binding protein C1D n=1 Tax=Clonorchis sinensis TaxID=79923 RepID=A0A419PJ01_CLOSI|nr:DNA-binding protein c1d [Clonorchis sinensis]
MIVAIRQCQETFGGFRTNESNALRHLENLDLCRNTWAQQQFHCILRKTQSATGYLPFAPGHVSSIKQDKSDQGIEHSTLVNETDILSMQQMSEVATTALAFPIQEDAFGYVDRSVTLNTLAQQGILQTFVDILGSVCSQASGSLKSSVHKVVPTLSFLFSFIIDRISNLEQIKEELSLCYAFNALFFIYLRCNGVDTGNHPIMQELNRVMTALKRCRMLTEKESNSRLKCDKEAASRFIKHALWQSAHSKAKKRRPNQEIGTPR